MRHEVTGVERLPAVPEPALLCDVMGCEQHLGNIYPRLGRGIPPEWYEVPAYYKGNPSATRAHGDDSVMPS